MGYRKRMTICTKERCFILIIIPFVIFGGIPVSAHEAGASWTSASEGYAVDVGYDSAALETGEPVPISFSLWRGSAETGDPVPFESVWVRVTGEDGTTLLATSVWNRAIGPALIYDFPEAGQYDF